MGQLTKFQCALREVLARGGVVGGTSAGMAALPEIMTHYQEYRGGHLTSVPIHGLGLFDGAVVEQHFDGRAGRLERFTGLLRDGEQLDKLVARPGVGAKLIGLAVDERTGLVVQADRLEVLGDSSVHVFIKTDAATLTRHTLKSGSKAELKRGSAGQATLVK